MLLSATSNGVGVNVRLVGYGLSISRYQGIYNRISREHTSATCAHKATGHRDDATAVNTLGGSDKDKGWDSAHT